NNNNNNNQRHRAKKRINLQGFKGSKARIKMQITKQCFWITLLPLFHPSHISMSSSFPNTRVNRPPAVRIPLPELARNPGGLQLGLDDVVELAYLTIHSAVFPIRDCDIVHCGVEKAFSPLPSLCPEILGVPEALADGECLQADHG